MRALLVALMLTVATQAGAGSDISGILACNPNKTGRKPVLYAFDGKYLLRDNQTKTPFIHIASIGGFLEIYFAFLPSERMNREFQYAAAFNQSLKVLKENVSNRLNGPEGEKYHTAFSDFQKFCSEVNYNHKFSEYLGFIDLDFNNVPENTKEIYSYLNRGFVELGNFFKSEYLSCARVKGKKISNFVQTRTPLERVAKNIEISVEELDVNEFHQVKLTVNLNEMSVAEEVLNPNLLRGSSKFKGEKFQYQSLEMDVPEIVLSETITPIGRDIRHPD
ncbi:hypothetical protein N9O21_00100 [Rhodobacteraceae bacterium]|nr:hypothetical protein [Paracoccaceae bacterium]